MIARTMQPLCCPGVCMSMELNRKLGSPAEAMKVTLGPGLGEDMMAPLPASASREPAGGVRKGDCCVF